jgi:hypothetical protein
MTHKMVEVVWEDAYAPDLHQTWVEVETKQTWKPWMVRTVGFLLYDGPEGVIVSDTTCDGFTGQRQQIPRGMIREINMLGVMPATTKRRAT